MEWAIKTAGRVKEVTGQEVQLWQRVLSPEFGTIVRTAWFDDLTSIETVSDKLQAEPSFVALENEGIKYTNGSLDDAIYMPVHGQPDPSRRRRELREGHRSGRHHRTGRREARRFAHEVLLSTVTGPYGALAFMSGYETIGAFETAQTKFASDATFIKLHRHAASALGVLSESRSAGI